MKKIKRLYQLLGFRFAAAILGGILVILMPAFASAAESSIGFKGTLVEDPCTIAPGPDGESVEVNFGNVPDKNLYRMAEGHSWKEKFHILLQDCDLSLGTKVKVTFTGPEDSEQPGLLALSNKSGARHVAVAITKFDGTLIPLNKQTDGYILSKGTTELVFAAYLSSPQSAIRNHTIGLGTIDATATYILEYI
ncbi:TPA: type 1 fimbrial protein [Enterobacter hormaechei subsp. steigerwaltii]|nr:type 1 fimbrial protein [Enterobacter hormaechei subsp. steigerwaltii]